MKSDFVRRQDWFLQLMAMDHKQEVETPQWVITNLLGKYKEVFAEPIGLPPKRAFDHPISLKEGKNPVSLRPYRYPHYKKSKIEKIVLDLLASWGGET